MVDCKNISVVFQGIDRESFRKPFLGKSIRSIHFPETHSLINAWGVRIMFDDSTCISLAGLSTRVGDRVEFGSLKIISLNDETDFLADDISWSKINVTNFQVSNIDLIVYRSEEIYCEAGISFLSSADKQIMFLASDAPCAITIKLPDASVDCMDGEFEFESYNIVKLE